MYLIATHLAAAVVGATFGVLAIALMVAAKESSEHQRKSNNEDHRRTSS